MKKKLLTFMCAAALIVSCSTSGTDDTTSITTDDQPTSLNQWSIPVGDVLDGGPGRDGIPALTNPTFTSLDNTGVLLDTDLIIGFKQGDDVRAYQHIVLDWHEIVNDKIGDVSLAVTYCPLTGTGIGWNRIVNDRETTFGVSGLLYNTNLIPFDRATSSNWSQILNESVNGTLLGKKAELIQIVEMDWKTWKTMYPNTKLLSLDTGFSRTYGVYPYGRYKTDNSFFLFPVPRDNRLPSKERVLAIIDGESAKAYRFEDLIAENLVRDIFKGRNYVVLGNANFMMSYELNSDQEALEFTYAFEGAEVVMTDNEGSEWNIFGEAISGPRMGQTLKTGNAFMGYWFSIPAFYTTEIFSN